MNLQWTIQLPHGATVLEDGGDLIVQSEISQARLASLSPVVRRAVESLNHGPSREDELAQAVQEADGSELPHFYYALETLAKNQLLWYVAKAGEETAATLIPISGWFHMGRPQVNDDDRLQLSRFAHMRRNEQNLFVIESPLSLARVVLYDARLAALCFHISAPATVVELAAAIDLSAEEVRQFAHLLVAGGFAQPIKSETTALPEGEDPLLCQWEFHDLLFHSRSRMGRHSNPTGGNFRFYGVIPPQPAVKSPPEAPALPLYCPDLERLEQTDPSLTRVLENRASIRAYDERPVTLKEIGEFLYRVARVKETYSTHVGDFTRRPYPSGGASYELEFYLNVHKCNGLERGFYYYAPAEHSLYRLRRPDSLTESMLQDAWNSTGRICYPEILVVIAARFQRVSWKYDAMAYATILKNVGVAYQTMYLVATAMDLAPSGLGLGNSETFARVASTDFLGESSVGEFILGRKKRGEA